MIAFHCLSQDVIDRRLEEIEAGGAAAIVCRVWAAHYGQQSKHVQWDWRDAAMLGGPGGGSEEALAEIKVLCGALGPAACAGICGVYAQSYAGCTRRAMIQSYDTEL